MSKNLSSQDIRAKILNLRDTLVMQLEFIQEAIDRDYDTLKRYFARYGDLNYRPVIGRDIDGIPNYGEKTEIVIEPLAAKYRATIKSLLDSIRVIEAEILPEDNPEGESTAGSGKAKEVEQKRASLRESFNSSTKSESTAFDSIKEHENAVLAAELVPTPIQTPLAPIKPAAKTTTQAESSRTPKVQAKFVAVPKSQQSTPAPIDTTPIPKPQAQTLSSPHVLDAASESIRNDLLALSPTLRNRILTRPNVVQKESTLDKLKKKYQSETPIESEDTEDEES
jgi:hypothetical protein